MSDKSIGDYTAANSIDPSNDYYLIEQSGVYKKINRNVGLGLSSAPLGLTDSQSPQNKAFDNTNTLTIKTGNLILQSSSDATKQAIFSAASITAGQTRTFTFPDASGTLATIAGTQTLTNKTLTSPTITGGSIDNSTITVDSISGHTSGTVVTIANLQISNGVLNSNNSVVTANIADGAITPAKLVSGAGSGWSWQSWTPTWTNITVGNATVDAKYTQIGKSVFARIYLKFGTTTSLSGDVTFTLPVTAVAYTGTASITPMGVANMYNQGANVVKGIINMASTTTGGIRAMTANTTYVDNTALSSTAPFTWATNYEIGLFFNYEAA